MRKMERRMKVKMTTTEYEKRTNFICVMRFRRKHMLEH